MPTFGWIKNPLSIIAIFISLIYGISGLLFGFSVSRLTPENQTVLVWFIVLFPVAVLAVFSWLVAKHHHKLYGPGDYRGDETFAQTFPTATVKEVSHKLEREIQHQQVPPQIEAPEEAVEAPIDVETDPQPPHGVTESKEPRDLTEAETVFVLENLAVQEFQREFRGAVRRDVKLRDDLIADAIVENNVEYVVIEVKVLLGKASWYAFTALQSGARSLQLAQEELQNKGIRKPIATLLCVVVEESFPQEQLDIQIKRIRAEFPARMMLRAFRAPQLLQNLPRATWF